MKKIVTIWTALATMLFAAAIGLTAAPTAAAFPDTIAFGSSQKLYDANNTVVQSLTVSGLKKSDDRIDNVALAGKLWEATVTIDAVEGTVTPAIPFFNARTPNNDNYRVLFQAFTSKGLNPENILQGNKATGKIYFDVTGAAPTKVAYNNGVQELIVWG